MTVLRTERPLTPRLALAAAVLLLAGCGGGGSNPLNNPPDVLNPVGTSGQQKLAFAYFQYCIEPLLVQPLTTPDGSTATCASGGCHDTVHGTGGALRLVQVAADADLSGFASADASQRTDLVTAIRASDMYKNFYSAQAATQPGDAANSRLLLKPLVRNVLHGGGLILRDQDLAAQRISYWIDHPTPVGQDEFSAAAYSMFTPMLDLAHPEASTCNLP